MTHRIVRVPLSEFLHITHSPDGCMNMQFGKHNHNHIGTVHASAQYALAEIGTGALIADLYPEHRESAFAVLRRGEIKYTGSATSNLTAKASLSDEKRKRLDAGLRRRGRALVSVGVELLDAEGAVASRGRFEWYIELSRGVHSEEQP